MLLRRTTLLDGSRADVRLDGETIAEVRADGGLDQVDAIDLSGYVLLPAPVEPHAHLDKALTAGRVKVQPGDLETAIEAWHEQRRGLGADDIARRAEAAALTSLARGVTAIRTHVDVGEGIELRAAKALIEVRDRLHPLLDIQVVALSYPLAGPGEAAENRALVRKALELGVDVVGGAPHIDPDPVGHIEVCLELAAEFGRPVDLHMDEHMRASSIDLLDLACMTGEGFAQPVTASHCVSLGLQPPDLQRRAAADVARAGISVVSCPGTNLHLQGRELRTATPRGITALKALLEAGVTVAGGGDNVQDFFHPLGCGDALQTASLLVLAGQLDVPTAYRLVSENARAVLGLRAVTVEPGSPAELLAVAGGSLREAIASTTEDRLVFRRGRLVERTRVEREPFPPASPELKPYPPP
ncbi:MAG: amidohydrolase family protein [Microbacterium sp.]|uniref:amidohydrolase family protein n=1 Tax=Microbacterium sp. TaxID=51671 RepID=UPI003D6F774E